MSFSTGEAVSAYWTILLGRFEQTQTRNEDISLQDISDILSHFHKSFDHFQQKRLGRSCSRRIWWHLSLSSQPAGVPWSAWHSFAQKGRLLRTMGLVCRPFVDDFPVEHDQFP